MSKPTRTELVRVREATYRPFVPAEKRCDSCRYCTKIMATRFCSVPSHKLGMIVNPNAVCDAWEARP